MFNQVVSILFPVLGLAFAGLCVGLWIRPDFRPINRVNMDLFVPALTFSSLVVMPLDVGQAPLLSAVFLAVLSLGATTDVSQRRQPCHPTIHLFIW